MRGFYSSLFKLWLQNLVVLMALLKFDNFICQLLLVVAVKTTNESSVRTDRFILLPKGIAMNLCNLHRRGAKLLAY